MTLAQARTNPLPRLAHVLPERAAFLTSIGARLAGIVFAVVYAFDQSYDRTQVVTVAIALAAAATFVPVGRFTPWLSALGAGLLFFGGVALMHRPPGVGMLIAGLIAWLAVLALSYHRGRGGLAVVFGGFCGCALLFAMVVVIALSVEG